jgi:ABC exporter DevB family membrane fusion protein
MLWLLLTVVFAGCGAGGGSAPAATASGSQTDPVALAAPGRIEGATEVVEVGAGMDGLIGQVLVEEGQRVEAGTVLARLVCDDLAARLASARATADAARQGRVRLVRGHRDEERRAAAAVTAAARAVLERARQRHERFTRLASGDSIVSQEDLDSSRRDLDVAEASLRAATEQEALANASPLPEELAKADAEIQAAQNRAAESEALLDKCSVKAPLTGTVLRLHLKAGEQVSLAYPRPIASLADMSCLRVRAEVDERDLAKVHDGQRVEVKVDALPDAQLAGRVSRLEPIMGRKRVRTGDPAEKSDRDIQEVLVDLDGNDPRLVVGLRVTVLFLEAPPSR